MTGLARVEESTWHRDVAGWREVEVSQGRVHQRLQGARGKPTAVADCLLLQGEGRTCVNQHEHIANATLQMVKKTETYVRVKCRYAPCMPFMAQRQEVAKAAAVTETFLITVATLAALSMCSMTVKLVQTLCTNLTRELWSRITPNCGVHPNKQHAIGHQATCHRTVTLAGSESASHLDCTPNKLSLVPLHSVGTWVGVRV